MNSSVIGIETPDNPGTETAACIRSTCPYCGTGCGVEALLGNKMPANPAASDLLIQGDRSHPTNHGRLCSKGSNLIETLDPSARLLHPVVDGQPANWDEALGAASDRIRRIIDQHGPDAFAIYCSGQLLTEDYYVANKLMKGFIGSANIDTNSRLCMSSAVAGHKRSFGSDSVPGCYEDLDQADLVVLTGSNTAWCHPILFQRIKQAKSAAPGRKVVVIDPRSTPTCEIADLHLPLKPGSDTILFNGLLQYLASHVKLDYDFIDQHTEGFGEAVRAARESAPDIATVAKACDLEPAAVETFYRWFMATAKTVTCFSQGVNQSSSGTDKVNAIINVHLATGRIGKPGMGPLSLTGQPNAMGGREVGGLANQLAAHLELDNAAHRDLVQRFWKAPNLAEKPGHKAVELFQAIEAGKVKGVWIIATNPVDSLPDANRVRDALANCDLVMVSDCMSATDTAEYAHIRFPAAGWGERDGTVTNAERRISRQRAFLPLSGEAKPDWWIISRLAEKLGFQEAFDYQSPWQVFREHARLSGVENRPDAIPRAFDLSGLAEIDAAGYDDLNPIQWPVNASHPEGCERLFGEGQFFTPDGRARLVTIEPRAPANAPDSDYPLILNTGRIRDQWHTMTRTGLSPRLSAHRPEPFVEVNPQDARLQRLAEGSIARIESRWGSMLARVQICDSIRPGQLFVPMHWTAQFASQGRMGALVNPAVDPLSGQPESKHTPVRIEPYRAAWYGFLLTRQPQALATEYAVRATGDGFLRYELADGSPADNWQQRSRDWIQGQGEWLECHDPARASFRTALIQDGQLQAVLVVGAEADLPDREWLASLFTRDRLSDNERRNLLSGQAPPDSGCGGAVVCACYGIGRNTITDAIQAQGLDSVEAVGKVLKAGTNCGSCKPEIARLLTP